VTAQPGVERPLRVLVVDDEPLARARLSTLLRACRDPSAETMAQADSAAHALACLQQQATDLVLLDVHMPGMDGLSLARQIADMPYPPALVFVTAYAEHAVDAFELDAVDYLTKPVRQDRLQAALHKVLRFLKRREAAPTQVSDAAVLVIQDRHRTERLPVAEVLYFKAELKYITVRTAARSYVIEGSLGELEARYGDIFIRVHRNALVAKRAARALQRHHDPHEGEGWALTLEGVDAPLVVSRRQLAAVREMLLGHQAVAK
jgi:two-component system response regulator AlgR